MKTILILIALAISSSGFAADRYVSDSLGFEISAPAPGSISGIYQHCLFYLPASDGFAANVNLQVQEYSGTLSEYKTVSESEFERMGLKTIRSAIEQGVFTVEYSGKMSSHDLHWYAKAFKKGNKVYLITATALETRWKNESTALVDSVNSFKLK